METPTIVPFVKWVGGKRQIVSQLLQRVPATFNTYYEPFVGGGALWLALRPTAAVLGDLNAELINAYQVLRTRHQQLQRELLWLELAHSDRFYDQARGLDRLDASSRYYPLAQDKVSRAARFIYLNKASFNGIYRVNAQGHFNVPGNGNAVVQLFDVTNWAQLTRYFRAASIKFVHGDFAKTLRAARAGDFVYLDPPYDYEQTQNGFDAFQPRGFGRNGQVRLAAVCADLDRRGVKFLLSNHNTALVRDLYRDFHIEVIQVRRLVGGKNAARGLVEEVLISNYALPSATKAVS